MWCQAVLLTIFASLAPTTAFLSLPLKDTAHEISDAKHCQFFVAILVKCEAGVENFNKIKNFVKENIYNCMDRPVLKRPEQVNVYYPSITIDAISYCRDAKCVDNILARISFTKDTCVPGTGPTANDTQTEQAIHDGLRMLLLDEQNNQTGSGDDSCMPTLIIVSDFESQSFAEAYEADSKLRINISHLDFRLIIINATTDLYLDRSSISDDDLNKYESYNALAGKNTKFCALRSAVHGSGLSGIAIAAIIIAAIALLAIATGIIYAVYYKNKHLDWRKRIMNLSNRHDHSVTIEGSLPLYVTSPMGSGNSGPSQRESLLSPTSAQSATSSGIQSGRRASGVIYPSWLQNPSEYRQRSLSKQISRETKLATDLWETSRDQVIVKRDVKLGNGAYGEVFKGLIIGKAPIEQIYKTAFFAHQYEDCECAVKMLHPYSEAERRTEFLREMQMMKELGFHPNVVSILGCITVTWPICLLLEYAYYGDLARYLRERKDQLTIVPGMEHERKRTSTNEDTVSAKDLLSFAWQVSDGMEYLHELGFVHRDLAARNVFVDRSKNAMIGDFGLCRKVDDLAYTSKAAGRLPIKWMAIESLKSYQFSTKSDVWSFGVLLYEIFTMGMVPYIDTPQTEMVSFLSGGKRLPKPKHASNEIYSIMQSCWMERPADRPSATELRESLAQHLEDAMEDCGYLNLSQVPNVVSRTSTFGEEDT